jgi:hypothetical protein
MNEFDYRISNSVFIEDADNPGLPIYSEKGYNSFGVYWGLLPLTTKWLHDPSKVVVENDSCHIFFSAATGSDDYTLKVSLPQYLPSSYSGLISLNGKSFDLSGEECAVALLYYTQPTELKILNGSFTIKRAQNMSIDREPESVVLSGTFSFKATVDGELVAFSNGRFDMRFGEENFFYLQGS